MSNASLKDQLQAVAKQFDAPIKTPVFSKVDTTVRRPSRPLPQPQWLSAVLYGLELLKAHFPFCFKLGKQTAPLKKGIKQDLIKQLSMMGEMVTEDKLLMIKALTYYVNTMTYHRCMIAGAIRIDLMGSLTDSTVSQEEAAYSLMRYQNKLKTRKKISSNK